MARAAEGAPLGIAINCNEHLPPANFEFAHGVSKPPPVFPPEEAADWGEGWVLFNLTVGTNGVPKDVITIDQMGSDAFVTAALDSVRQWRYLAPQRNGKPAEVYGTEVDVEFAFEDTAAGKRVFDNDEFRALYERAQSRIADRSYDRAIGLLRDALNRRLGLYARAMGSYYLALSLMNVDKKNWPEALIHIKHATFKDGSFLDKSVLAPAMGLRVALEAQDGNYKEAICTYRHMHTRGSPLPPEAVQTGEQTAALLDNPAPLVIPAVLHAAGSALAPMQWAHPMLRRKFSFNAVSGAVKSFRLMCTGALMEGPVVPDRQWTIPPDAGSCKLLVFGSVGATFQLIEQL